MKSKHIKKLFHFLPFTFSFLLVTCTSTEPPPVTNTVTIAQIDTVLTEVKLSVKLNNISVPAEITLLRNNTPLFNFIMNRSDTTVIDTTVEPNSTYKYKATTKSGSETFTSNEYTAVTMDTTSQNFTFEYFEFGDGYETTYLNDVWVFNENNVWAVGYLGWQDSIGNPNIIRWNGNKWYLPKYNGLSSGIEGIWAFDSSYIFFAAGGLIKYQNGEFSDIPTNLGLEPWQGIYKLWGSSLGNIWGVGPGGTIVHYNGSKWEKIEFDTQCHFYNITGNKDNGIAYAVARNFQNTTLIVELSDAGKKIIYDNSDIFVKLSSLSIDYHMNYLYLVDYRIWRVNLADNKYEEVYGMKDGNFLFQLSCPAMNDIYAFGDYYNGTGEFVHYNGIRATRFELPSLYIGTGDAFATDEIAVTVGASLNKAFLIRIRRI